MAKPSDKFKVGDVVQYRGRDGFPYERSHHIADHWVGCVFDVGNYYLKVVPLHPELRIIAARMRSEPGADWFQLSARVFKLLPTTKGLFNEVFVPEEVCNES